MISRRVLTSRHPQSAIESHLIDFVSSLNFRLELEQPCRYRLDTNPPALVEDRVEYWISQAP
jgi:hypothetical protein